MNFKSKYYLPNSTNRIKHLQKVVSGRPVVIIAAGTSIYELEHKINKLINTDICYFGLNSFFVQEDNILKKIGKSMSVVMCSAPSGISELQNEIMDFLDRKEENIFISSYYENTFKHMGSDFNLTHFIEYYNKKLLFFYLHSDKSVPNKNLPLHFMISNSLLVLIQLAIIGKASKVILFGADGGYVNKKSGEWYYRQSDSGYRGSVDGDFDDVSPQKYVIEDTNKQFNPVAPIAIKNTYKTYNLSPIEILNCSEKSYYTPFPLISYDDALNSLITGLKIDVSKYKYSNSVEDFIYDRKNKYFQLERYLSAWEKYRWSIIKIISVKIIQKLKQRLSV